MGQYEDPMFEPEINPVCFMGRSWHPSIFWVG